MSSYKSFGERADKLAREAFKKVMDASNKLQKAESQARAYPQRTGAVDAEYYAKSARAAADLAEAKADYEKAKRELADMNRGIASIRAELQQQLAKDFRADPAQVDSATMDLLKSGILNTEDYIGLLEKNSGNITMTRVIKGYAQQHADKLHDSTERQRLKAVAMSSTGDHGALANFDVIAEVCHRAEHNTGMIQHYDELTASALESM